MSDAVLKAGDWDKAKIYAERLLSSATDKKDWNYGNAIHHGNLLLGRIALKNGDIEQAKKYLLKAGETPGSPQLNSFGPNMSLAKELLEEGERSTVLKYFELCRIFWKTHDKDLDEWKDLVAKGKIPNFGANLGY